ncbi:hypothetical protein MHYP_G00066210 [Metynnis hypsauchen]
MANPIDYFSWKSQPPLLRLTSSGRLLGGVDPAPPKTYSTRRGPLLLYSEDLALSSCQPHKVNRRRRAFRTSREEAEVQLHTLQDLTEAILAYGKKQAKVTCHTSVTQPLLSASKRATHRLCPYHWPAEEHYVTQCANEGREEYASSTGQGNSVYPRSGQVRYQPRFLCLPRPNRPPSGSLPPIAQSLAPMCGEDRPHLAPGDPVTPKTKGPEDLAINKDVKTSFRTAMGTARVRMSPIPEPETTAQEKLTGWPEDQMVTEHLTGYPKDISGQWKQSAIETGGEESGHSLRPAYMDSSLGCSHLSRVNNYRRHMEGACQQGPAKQNATGIHVKKTNVSPNPGLNFFHLPLINQASPSDSDSKDQSVKAGSNTRQNHKNPVPQLPDIHLTNTNTETTGPKPPERTILRKVLVLLPSQKEKEKKLALRILSPAFVSNHLHGLSEDEEEREDGLPEKKEMKEDVLCRGVEQKGGVIVRGEENEPGEHGCQLKATEQYQLIWFEPEEDKEHQTAPGLLPPLVGRRGPGKQSSMALYRQDPLDPADQSESGIIRGSLPLVLRECEKGRALGTLIMGPAGEIIRLSFWDALMDTEDHPVLDDATREHVLRVMTSEGVLEQPWTILLEEQTTHPDRMNSSELEAEPDHKEEASSNQEDRAAAAEYTEVVKNGKRGADGKRMGGGQAYAPEQRSGKMNPSIENQPYTKGEDVEIKRRGRTQGLQPEGGVTPGSPKPKITSASSPQNTTLSTHTAVKEHIHKAKPGSQTNTKKDNIRSPFRKAGGGDDAENAQIRKVKKEEEVDQHVRGVRGNKQPQKKTVQTNMDSEESEDAVYTADTTPGPILKKKKTAEEAKKPNASTSQPKGSAKPQNNVNKVKKKTKQQAAFIVGKPRQMQEIQQIAKEADQPEMSERTVFKTEEKEPENEAMHDHCCNAPGHTLDTDLVSVYQEDHTVAVSPRTHSSATVSSRTHSSTEFSFRMHGSDTASSRAHSSAAVPTARESYRRTSTAAEPEACNPAPLSLTQLPSHSADPTHHHTSNPTKCESGVDEKCGEEAISLTDSKTAAQAGKAERRRLDVERKRKEKEEEWRRQQEREEREEKMRLELEEEQRQRSEQARLKKLAEEDERQRQEQKEKERQKREKAETERNMERERRRQEEKRRLLEQLQRERQEKEEKRAAELKRRQQEEEAQRELERRKLQEMEESERLEYLRRKQEEEEERRKTAEERRRAEEEAATQVEEEARLLAQLTAKQRAALEHKLRFHRSLFVEAGGLEQTQDISRPWVFSYFNLLKLLGLTEPPEELVKDVL